MKSNIYKIILGTFAFAFFVSCDEDGYEDFEQVNSPSVEMNGEWYVDIIDEASGEVLGQHFLHKTYDTNNGDNTMIIDDLQNGYWIKGVVDVDLDALTFSTTDEENQNDPGSTFSITEGKILKGAGHSRTGVAVDSIYFKGEFSYDPGTIIVFAGHKRTGFEEDDF